MNMKNFFKRLGQLILVIVVLIAIAYPFRRDPIAIIPGKQLSGEEKAYPADWTFTNDHMLVKVESRPEDPYSVTTLCFLIDGKLHIPAQKGSTKQWPQHVLADSRVRIKVGDTIYPAKATLVSKDAVEMIMEHAMVKLAAMGREKPAAEDLPKDVWLFEISQR